MTIFKLYRKLNKNFQKGKYGPNNQKKTGILTLRNGKKILIPLYPYEEGITEIDIYYVDDIFKE